MLYMCIRNVLSSTERKEKIERRNIFYEHETAEDVISYNTFCEAENRINNMI